MAYGRGFYEDVLVFPSLMTTEEIDAVEASRIPVEMPVFQPIAVIRREHPALARELEKLWGFPGFESFVERFIAARQSERVHLTHTLLLALLALTRHHAENRRNPGSIDAWVVDRTRTGE